MDRQRRPRESEAVAVGRHVIDRRRGFAEDGDANSLALEAAGLQRRDPVGAEDLVREQSCRGDHAGRVRRGRTPRADRSGAGGCPAGNRSETSAPRRRNGRIGCQVRCDVEPEARHRVDIPRQARAELRCVHRERHGLVALTRCVQVPLRAEQLLRVSDADRRADSQVRDVDGRCHPVGLERASDGIAPSRRGAVLRLQRRQREVVAVARRGRIAGRFDGVCNARLVGDQAQLERELQPRRRGSQVLQPLVGDVAEVDTRRRRRDRARPGHRRKQDRSQGDQTCRGKSPHRDHRGDDTEG